MKYFLSLLLLLLVTCFLSIGQTDDPYATYSPTNIIYYFQNPSQYYRIDYQWYLKNTGQNSITYYNGNVYATDTGGAADIGYFDALSLFPTNLTQIPFAVIDSGINLSHPEFTNLLAIGNSGDLIGTIDFNTGKSDVTFSISTGTDKSRVI